MGDALHQGVFQYVRKGAVPYVVQQDGGLDGFGFAVEDEVALGRQFADGFAHQVEGAERVLEAGVLCAGVDYGREAQLADARQPLHDGVAHQVVEQAFGYFDEPEDGVVDDFAFVGHRFLFGGQRYEKDVNAVRLDGRGGELGVEKRKSDGNLAMTI